MNQIGPQTTRDGRRRDATRLRCVRRVVREVAQLDEGLAERCEPEGTLQASGKRGEVPAPTELKTDSQRNPNGITRSRVKDRHSSTITLLHKSTSRNRTFASLSPSRRGGSCDRGRSSPSQSPLSRSARTSVADRASPVAQSRAGAAHALSIRCRSSPMRNPKVSTYLEMNQV